MAIAVVRNGEKEIMAEKNVPQKRIDWDATSGLASIKNKPEAFPPEEHTHIAEDVTDLHEVATSGSYDDLEDKPRIPKIKRYVLENQSIPAGGRIFDVSGFELEDDRYSVNTYDAEGEIFMETTKTKASLTLNPGPIALEGVAIVVIGE